MVNSVSVQTLEFLYSALLGVALGVLYDIIRVIRAYMPKSRAITALFDILFWCAAIISLLAFVLTSSEGKMRWYVLVGTFCGGFVYMSALSRIVFKVLISTVAALKKLLFIITHPIYLLLGWIWRGAKGAERKAEKRIRENVKKKRMKKRKADKDGSKKAEKAKKSVS